MIRQSQSVAATECQLAAQFAAIREKLLNVAMEDRLKTLLADWVVPADRRLPLVFMHWSLRQLLAAPFEELRGTPGVGQKKIESLIQLLHRIAEASSIAPIDGTSNPLNQRTMVESSVVSDHNQIDCSQVSETVWARWRQTIIELGLEHETLGRFAPSLQPLSRVIWHTPLGFYTPLTLAEIRAQKTYGEKRVQAVLEVFGALQGRAGLVDPQPDPAVRFQPTFIRRLADWTRAALARNGRVDGDEIRSSFIEPLFQQIEIDGGAALADLARRRLGLHGQVESVLRAARRLGFMRARVYQLLNEVATIVAVRWPEGSDLVKRLNVRLRGESDAATCLAQFEAARDLFFPELRDESPKSTIRGGSIPSLPAAIQSPAGFFSGHAIERGTIHSQLA